MINVGINGFGRIGKCTFLQLIHNTNISIKGLNACGIEASEIEDYLRYDTTHRHHLQFTFSILSKDMIQINHHIIKLFQERDAKNIDWKEFDCVYVVEATGAYLTEEKCKAHNCDYVIMSAPPKDNTKTFIYSVNDEIYDGEKIISGSSCTTNAISPLLKLLEDEIGIKSCIFTTIHATTGSQNTVDIMKKCRTSRSILNNIIPHTTGASKSIIDVIPVLENKIHGTSLRVPVVNCSLVDINIELSDNSSMTLEDIKELIEKSPFYKKSLDISEKKLVSCDFITTTVPCILDLNASMKIEDGKFKLMVWYDNEWSYSAQLIRLIESVYKRNNAIKERYLLQNQDFENKRVVCRFDYNIPINQGIITDTFRIQSTISTLKFILAQNPKSIYLISHLGRPKGKDMKYSLSIIIPVLEDFLGKKIHFIEQGLDFFTNKTINEFSNIEDESPIYLLENIRFHKEETNFSNIENDNSIYKNYSELGDIYVTDAFGCLHRNHMSITGFTKLNKPYCLGFVIEKELKMIENMFMKNKRILGIVGGNKIADKLPIIDSLKGIPNARLFIGGGLATQYDACKNISVMTDAWGNENLELVPRYIFNIKYDTNNGYDIGDNSLFILKQLIDTSEIIFWNGALGVIENDHYKKGSLKVIEYLNQQSKKIIIIGGGETSSLVENKENGNIYVSTGGGALLEYIQKRIVQNSKLVGLECFY